MKEHNGKNPRAKAIRRSRTAQNLLAAVLGGLASIVGALVFVRLNELIDFSSSSLTFWSVTPVWAAGSALAAASGYYYASLLLNHRPTRLLSWSIISFSVGVFFLHYLGLCFLFGGGQPSLGLRSFGDFLAAGFSSTALQLRLWGANVGSPLGLGSLGSQCALLQVFGFWTLGASLYFHLRSRPYCADCGKFFVKKGKRTQYTSEAKEFAGRLELLSDSLVLGDFQDAIAMHASSGSASHKNAKFSWTIEVRRCPDCHKHWLSFSVDKLVGSRWRQKTELEYVTYSSVPIQLNVPFAAKQESPYPPH